MDAAVFNVLCGLVANGLTSLLVTAGSGIAGKLRSALRKRLKGDLVLLEAYRQGAAGLERGSGSLLEMLRTPEFETVIRQVFSIRLTGAGSGALELAREESRTILTLAMGSRCSAELSDGFFDVLVSGCERALEVFLGNSTPLAAHDLRSSLRHNLLVNEIAAIHGNLQMLRELQSPDLEAILRFEEGYRQQVAGRHRHITPPDFETGRKKHPIDSLYVSPRLTKVARRRGDQESTLGFSDFLSQVYKTVVLGSPGAGKSTLVAKVCYDLAHNYGRRLVAARPLTPILVVLRDYGAAKKVRSLSILQHIESVSASRYQLAPPTGAFEYLLLNGRALVVFDGMDELLDTTHRREISDDIESFCSLYPSVPVLVTSREVGYEQAPLDEDRFDVYRLAQFDADQADEYARKWFALDADLTVDERTLRAEAFSRESRVAPDLRSNPLMLALMCNIYRGENYIPRNRPEVYEKCALMLFDKWDKKRSIFVRLPFEEYIRPAMVRLAHWIYSSETLQSGVTEDRLVAEAAAYLRERSFKNEDMAQKAAREFIEFCRGRAWVFTDTGTTAEGERLYQFTHRTFLEYFAACHLVRTQPTPEALAAILEPRIARREWDVVAQLAYQMQHRSIEGAGDTLLRRLVELARSGPQEEAWNALSFAARCLGFMVPKWATAHAVSLQCIEAVVGWPRHRPRNAARARDLRRETIESLLYAATDNQLTVAEAVELALVRNSRAPSVAKALRALEIACNLSAYLYRYEEPNAECLTMAKAVSDRVLEQCPSRLSELAPRHQGAAIDAFWRGAVKLQELVEWHGAQVLFKDRSSIVFDSRWLPIAPWLLRTALAENKSGSKGTETSLGQLKEAGRVLLHSEPPWVTAESLGTYYGPWTTRQARDPSTQPDTAPLEPSALFGAFMVIAPWMELESERTPVMEYLEAERALAPLLAIARAREAPPSKATQPPFLSLDQEQAQFIAGWLNRRFRVVAP